jgi:hypothetical protein
MPTFTTTGHATQFGSNSPTVSIHGTDSDGYITYTMSGSFSTFASSTKYFAIKVIFDTPFITLPGVIINPANTFTAQIGGSIDFFADQNDNTLTYFMISGISGSTPTLSAGVLAWSYQVGGIPATLTSGTVTSIATTAPLVGGILTTSGTISIPKASASIDGYLAHSDWTTFNNKFNLVTTSVTPGNYINANISVDAYGRITAASNSPNIIPAGSTTNSVLGTPTIVGALFFNPADYTYTTLKFRAVVANGTSGVISHVNLHDVTNNVDIHTFTLIGSTANTKLEIALTTGTPGADVIANSEVCYEVSIYVDSPSGGTNFIQLYSTEFRLS